MSLLALKESQRKKKENGSSKNFCPMHLHAIKIGFFGFLLYYFVDYVMWYEVAGLRSIDMSGIHPALAEIWISLTPGVIHPAIVIMGLDAMFHKKGNNNQGKGIFMFWFFVFMVVQATPAFYSAQRWPEPTNSISRDMNRGPMIFLATAGFAVLALAGIRGKDILKCFLLGVAVEGVFEMSLFLSGIRQTTFTATIIDSLIEFNCGIPIIVLLHQRLAAKEDNAVYDDLFGKESVFAYIKAIWHSEGEESITDIIQMKPIRCSP
ncbi:hypothetical protein ADUPG1_008949 [Aduncisulcus paluster]|uniref:Uncharacterized protein n=1 Tax=Aduncisulcus paluster TaxID=2918883 RepID=A0ABQ5KTS9_9EUKA|nr:hypothetical protein ADUPG1_008949 [Aduncisulcus paluster]